MGNFNKVLSVIEKQGGIDRPFRQIDNFRNYVNSCGLNDIGFVGSWFTWSMYRQDLGWIRERINHVFATTEWLSRFPGARLYHLASLALDHCWMLRMNLRVRQRKTTKLFRFEAM